MKNSFAALFLAVLLTQAGCNKGTSGGPGASSQPAKTNMIGQADETFSLDVPSTKLNQGETKIVSVGIKRGKNFGQDVSLKLDDLPKGVSLAAGNPVIKHGDTDAKLTLKAADDAALGDFTVKVLGHPTTGSDASSNLKIAVAKLDDQDGVDATADAAKAKWDEYTSAMQMQLDQLAAKYTELKDRAANAKGPAKTDLETKRAQAKTKLDVAAAKLDEIKSASVDGWEKLKEGVGNAFDDLKKMFA